MQKIEEQSELMEVMYELVKDKKVSPAERLEVMRLAQGYDIKEAAAESGLSAETIRARRKRLYRRLGLRSANEVVATILALTLKRLAAPAVRRTGT